MIALATRLLSGWTWRNRGRKFQQFSEVERSSRFEMLAAANATTDPERAALFLRHAADEARHADDFHKAALRYGLEQPIPQQFDQLHKTLGEHDFVRFVHRGEAAAIEKFEVWSQWMDPGFDRALLERTLGDEYHHARYTAQIATLPGNTPSYGTVRRGFRSLSSVKQAWVRVGQQLVEPVGEVLLMVVYLLCAPAALLVRKGRPDQSDRTHKMNRLDPSPLPSDHKGQNRERSDSPEGSAQPPNKRIDGPEERHRIGSS